MQLVELVLWFLVRWSFVGYVERARASVWVWAGARVCWGRGEEEENIWQLVNICARLLLSSFSQLFIVFFFFFLQTTEENPSKNKHIWYTCTGGWPGLVLGLGMWVPGWAVVASWGVWAGATLACTTTQL